MVLGLAGNGIVFLGFYFNTIVANAADADVATLHLEILIAVDTVLDSLRDDERQVLDGDVVAALDGVSRLSFDGQRAFALQL